MLLEMLIASAYQRTDSIERSPRGSVPPPPGPPPIENLPAAMDPMAVDTGQVSSDPVKSAPPISRGRG